MKKKWTLRKKITKKVDTELARFPAIIRQLLYNKGIDSKKEAEKFLDPNYIKFHDARRIFQIEKAAEEIINAIEEDKTIFIHGDYDVDGICATSILWDFLYREMNAKVMPFIPSRFEDGYGMSNSSLQKIKDDGGELVITVDCGIRDGELIKKWNDKGLEFIITDHHSFDKKDDKEIIPKKALAVVHPSHPKGEYPFDDIAGATVAWKLVDVIIRKLALDFDLEEYLDLVALATVADVMPLVKENRSIVKLGLNKLKKTKRVGLRRLMNDCGIDFDDLRAYHIGFVIGPRLNATGRLDHALDAVRLLSTQSLSTARELSEKLQRLNSKRQVIQKRIYEEAVEQIQENGEERKLYFVWGEKWEEGVMGIVAGKIAEKYHRPTLVATKKESEYTGSARSIKSFNMIEAITLQDEFLERYGGHPQAAGFTVGEENIELFRDGLLEIANKRLTDSDLVGEITIDAEIDLEDITFELIDWIERFAPFGYKNPSPKLLIRKLEVKDLRFVGSENNHISMTFLSEKTGEFIRSIGFNLADKIPDIKVGDKIDIVFVLEINEWNGDRQLQMKIKDFVIQKK